MSVKKFASVKPNFEILEWVPKGAECGLSMPEEIINNTPERKALGEIPEKRVITKKGWLGETKISESEQLYSARCDDFYKKYHEICEPYFKKYHEHSEIQPVVVTDASDRHFYLYKGNVYLSKDKDRSPKEVLLLILQIQDKERKKFERLDNKFNRSKSDGGYKREAIPEDVRITVWNRDDGKCSKCESRDKLEYDHIVPVSKGGSNTARNIELLCEACNREKSGNIC